MGKTLKIDNAVGRFSSIQEGIKKLSSEALNIVKKHLDNNAQPKWHKQIIAMVDNEMEDDLCDLEDEAIEQEEMAPSEEILDFNKKYPQIKLNSSISEEMTTQGFSFYETKRLVIIETPYANYPFNKETGKELEPIV